MPYQKHLIHSFIVSGSIAILSACSMYSSSIPSGYTYHHGEIKSPKESLSKKVSIEQRKYMDATQAEQFRTAVYDLLERLTMRAGMPPKPVYISTPQPMTTFYANIDNDLRESMRHIGYAISDTPSDAYVFTYEAQRLSDIQDVHDSQNNVRIILRVFDSYHAQAQQLTEEMGDYYIQGADLLKMGSANQKFLDSSAKPLFGVRAEQSQMSQPLRQQNISAPLVAVKSLDSPVSIDQTAQNASLRVIEASNDPIEQDARDLIIINNETSAPLPNLDQIEAEIQKLDIEIEKTKKAYSAGNAQNVVHGRVSRPVE